MESDESDGDTNCNWCTRYSHQRIRTGIREVRNKRTSGDHLDYNIFKIGQNTENNPGKLRKFAITQIPVKNYQLIFV